MALTTLPSAAFASGSVGTGQLADGAVTTEKLVADVNFRNLIINGDMSIAQRGTSVSSITSSGYYTLDRWRGAFSDCGTWTMSQSTDVPTGQGFAYSQKWDCTTAKTPLASGSLFYLNHRIEAQNLTQLKYGTSNAESLTLSFWVKSNKTGTYSLLALQRDNSDKMLTKTYTISSANTWEKKTITIPSDTSGVINNDNGEGIGLYWILSAGSNRTSGSINETWATYDGTDEADSSQVNLADSTSNEWYITGVQLEVGTSASDFEFLPYEVNFERCRRYYYVVNPNNTYYPTIQDFYCYNSSNCYGSLKFPTPMRTGPSVSMTNNGSFYFYPQNSFTINTSMLYSFNSDGEISYVRFYDGNAFSFGSASGLFEGGTFKCNAEL